MPTTLTHISIPQMSDSAAVAEVTRALKATPGANRLTVRLHDNGGGVVSILSNVELSAAKLQSAVEQAGFSVGSIETLDDALAAQMKQQAPARQASRNLALTDPQI